MPGGGGAAAAAAEHRGGGVARRSAHHHERAAARAQLEEIDVEELLAREKQSVIVCVPADLIVVEDDGPNYTPKVRRESKKARTARLKAAAAERMAAADN